MSYYLADDGDGDLTLWRDNGDEHPNAIAAESNTPDETWWLLLRGAGLDGETGRCGSCGHVASEHDGSLGCIYMITVGDCIYPCPCAAKGPQR